MYSKPSILLMDSGAHTVEEFACLKCSTLLGWRIVRAHEWPEKWKEGYSVLELSLLEESSPSSSSSLTPPDTPIANITHTTTTTTRRDSSETQYDDEEEREDPTVVAFNAYLQVASALSMGHRRASSEFDSRRPKPVGPRAITPTPSLPGTPPRRSVLDVRA